ncbi:MAG TPA: ATP-binding protein [Bacteroidales bacterium]|nr:ATP-binding protein [Bacteroidales bacterium]
MKELALHILDLTQNSIAADATLVETAILEDPQHDIFRIIIKDNGKGMTAAEVQLATDPFYTSRTTRKVGLGLSLFKQRAEETGGSFNIESVLHTGTKVTADFGYHHIDRPVLGDIAGVLVMLLAANPDIDFTYKHITPRDSFFFDTRDVRDLLGDVSVNQQAIIKFLKEMIRENIEALAA